MTKDELTNIGTAFTNLGGLFAERVRQEGQGATEPFPFFDEGIVRETKRLRHEGLDTLADAVAALVEE